MSSYMYVCVCPCMKCEISSSLTNMILLGKEATTFFFKELGKKPILSPKPVASRTAFETWL